MGILTNNEIESEVFKKISAYCTRLIEKKHIELEKTVTSHDDTQIIRGEIIGLRTIQKIGLAAKVTEANVYE